MKKFNFAGKSNVDWILFHKLDVAMWKTYQFSNYNREGWK